MVQHDQEQALVLWTASWKGLWLPCRLSLVLDGWVFVVVVVVIMVAVVSTSVLVLVLGVEFVAPGGGIFEAECMPSVAAGTVSKMMM